MMHLSYLKHFIIVGMIITLFTAGLLGYLDYVINILDSDHLALKVGTVRFSIYTMIISAISLAVLLLFERNRNTALKAALNLALFILVIAIPAARISLEGLIF